MADLDADVLGRLAEDGALVDGGVRLDEQLVEDRAGALWVADEEVVKEERDVEGDNAGVNQLPEVGLNFAALQADLSERSRVALHPEVAWLLGPLERAKKLARHEVLVGEARGLLEVELSAVPLARREGLDDVHLEHVIVGSARGSAEHAQ